MAYSSAPNLQRRLRMAKQRMQEKLAIDAPQMGKNIGVNSQTAGNTTLTNLMNPYLDYWGGGDLSSDRAAAGVTKGKNELLLNLLKKQRLASGRGYDIKNVGQRRSNLYNTMRTKRETARGIGKAEDDLMFQSNRNTRNRMSGIKQTKTRIAYEKEKAKEAAKRAKDDADTNAWIEVFSAIPALIATIYGGPAAGAGVYGGARSIGRSIV